LIPWFVPRALAQALLPTAAAVLHASASRRASPAFQNRC
jgi:hypothetical protein